MYIHMFVLLCKIHSSCMMQSNMSMSLLGITMIPCLISPKLFLLWSVSSEASRRADTPLGWCVALRNKKYPSAITERFGGQTV